MDIVLERDGHDQPWGFRLQGGVDVAMPLSVQRVLVGTPADGTLHKGDIISKISCTETKGITHQQAADLFNNAGNQISVQIKRAGAQNTHTVSAATSAPLVNGSTVQGPTPVPVSGGVALPGISSKSTARSENPIVRSLPKTQFVLKADLLRQQKQPPSMESLSIQSQPYRTLPLLQPSAKVRSDLGVGSICHLKMQDDHITGVREPQYVPQSQAVTARAKHDELIMKQKVTGTLQHIQQTQQSLTSVATHQQQQFNQAPPPSGGLMNKQYNSPLPLYSQENVQEVVRMQATGGGGLSPGQTVNPVNRPHKHMGLRGMPLSYDPEQSATWQIIHEEENCQLITEHGPTESKVYSI